MTIEIFDNNNMRQNIYLYYDDKSGDGVIIDAGCSAKDIITISETISKNSIKVKAILLTHGHFDHITAIDELKSLTGAIVYCHESERLLLEDPALNMSIKTRKIFKISPDKFFKDGDLFYVGDTALKVLHTPGHTQGGVCYYDEKNGNLFAGDVLFMNSIGRSDLPQGDSAVLLSSIKTKLLVLPEDTKVFPGHGMATSISHEKDSNPFL